MSGEAEGALVDGHASGETGVGDGKGERAFAVLAEGTGAGERSIEGDVVAVGVDGAGDGDADVAGERGGGGEAEGSAGEGDAGRPFDWVAGGDVERPAANLNIPGE